MLQFSPTLKDRAAEKSPTGRQAAKEATVELRNACMHFFLNSNSLEIRSVYIRIDLHK